MSARQDYPAPAQAWWLIAVLFVAAVVSIIDRGILNIVVDPVKASIGLSEVQIGVLQGLAFGIFYAIVGLPLGLGADRYSRKYLIVGGLLLWSCATIAGGFAMSFGGLFTSRILVGLGEAALAPAAISLIADLFPPEKRGRPISIYLMGQAVANGLAISVTGAILSASQRGAFRNLPALQTLEPWRAVFVICGVAGLLVAAALLTCADPRRHAAKHGAGLALQARASASYLRENAAIFFPLYLGFAVCFMAAYGAGAWTAVMLMRGFSLTPAALAKSLGPLTIAFGILGPLLAGALIDYNARRKAHVSKLTTLAVAPLFAVPSALAVFSHNPSLAIVLVAIIGAVMAMVGTTTISALQELVPANMRGITIALTGILNTLLGAASGPLLVALLTDHVFHDPKLVGYSIACVTVPALLIAAVCFAFARRALLRQLRTGGEVALLLTDGATGSG